MTTKEWLNQARRLQTQIDAQREQIARLRATIGCGTRNLSGMPGGGKKHDWTDTAIQAEELEMRLDGNIRELIALKQSILDAIEAVDDTDCRIVLEYRYLCGWSWQRIATAMHYDRTSVWRIHGRAVMKVERAGNPPH